MVDGCCCCRHYRNNWVLQVCGLIMARKRECWFIVLGSCLAVGIGRHIIILYAYACTIIIVMDIFKPRSIANDALGWWSGQENGGRTCLFVHRAWDTKEHKDTTPAFRFAALLSRFCLQCGPGFASTPSCYSPRTLPIHFLVFPAHFPGMMCVALVHKAKTSQRLHKMETPTCSPE